MKVGELSARIRVKEVWDEKKMKEEIMGGGFPVRCTASVRCTAVLRRAQHLVCTHGVHFADIAASLKMEPRGMQWCAKARWRGRHRVLVARSSTCNMQLGGYCSTL